MLCGLHLLAHLIRLICYQIGYQGLPAGASAPIRWMSYLLMAGTSSIMALSSLREEKRT